MEENNKIQSKQEVCSIKIMFPVDSDEQAISIKRKVADVLKDVVQVRSEFTISSMNR